MTTHSPLFLLAALGLLSCAGAATAAADTTNWKCQSCPYPKGITGAVEAGIGTVSEDSQKFGDYTGLEDKGAHLVLGGALRVRGAGGYYADLQASDLGLDTRSLGLNSGHEGLYSLHIGYAELPRHFADGARTPYLGNGGSRLTLPAGYPAETTATMPLANTLQAVDIGYKKKLVDVSATLLSFQNWTYRFSFTRDVRDGTRPMNAAFFSTAQQLVAPVDQTTDQFEVSAAYATRAVQATVAYQLSRFANGPEALTFDNPFTPVRGANRGQLALAPDNQMHQIVATAGLEITPAVRVSADMAYGRLTQNAGFLPATLNAALAPSVPQLPMASLDGKVSTFNSNVRLTATPMADLRVNASYAHNARENKTGTAAFPQVATDMFVGSDTRSNVPFSFTQDRFKLGADYRGLQGVKFSAGAERDYRSRPYHEVVTTRETTVWGRAGVQAGERLNLGFKLAKGDRTHSSYGVSTWFGSPENPLLRKYNLAERQRDTAGVRADFAATDTVSLGLAVDYSNDGYARSLVGLKNARSVNIAADLSAALTEKTQLTFFALSDRLRSRQAGSQTSLLPDWEASGNDRFHVLGLGVKHQLLGDKLDIGADLSFTRSKSDLRVDQDLAQPAFPQAHGAQDALKVHARYKLADNLWLNGSLWHERYTSTDWRLDGVLPGTVQNLLSLGQQSPDYRVTVLNVSLRYQF
jgi:MtrB/PioB family decaheme-associated outer membrane protein